MKLDNLFRVEYFDIFLYANSELLHRLIRT